MSEGQMLLPLKTTQMLEINELFVEQSNTRDLIRSYKKLFYIWHTKNKERLFCINNSVVYYPIPYWDQMLHVAICNRN